MRVDWIEKASRHRFCRVQGRPLGEWLQDLVSGDIEKQLRCAQMLDQLRSKTAEGSSVDEHWARIDRALRSALSRKKFPQEEFVRRLVLGLDASLQRKQSEIQEEYAREVEGAGVGLQGRGSARPKLDSMNSMRLFLAHSWVFDALNTELMSAQKLLRRQVKGRLSHQVAQWLARVGPAGRSFLPEALDLLDAGRVQWHPWTPALAAIAGGDVEAMSQLAERLDASDYTPPPPYVPGMPGRPPSRQATRLRGTLQTFALIGAEAREVPGVLERCEALIEHFPTEAAEAFGAVGGNDEVVLAKLLRASRSKEWGLQAGAILGLKHFPEYAEKVVPVLSELLVTYEEMDGDWTYAGEQERIFESLGGYGEAALPAIETLTELGFFTMARHRDEEQKSFFVFLGDLGVAAADRVLEPLEALVAEFYRDEESDLEEDFQEARRDFMTAVWALRRVRGGT